MIGKHPLTQKALYVMIKIGHTPCLISYNKSLTRLRKWRNENGFQRIVGKVTRVR